MLSTTSYQTLLVLVILLILTFLFLLGYTFWTRAKKAYWKRYKIKFRDYFYPILFTFIEEGSNSSDADQVISKLTKRTKDIAFFLELLNEMTEILRGEEREQLNLLINHELFYNFYREHIFSFSRQKQLIATVYFEKNGVIDDQVCERLLKLSKSKNTKLAYGASKALQGSDNLDVRRKALVQFIKREDASDLMAGELLHLFYHSGIHRHEVIGKALKEILLLKNVPPAKKKIIILYIAQQNYYEFSDFLLQYLKKLLKSTEKAPLMTGLIRALGQLHAEEAAPVIKKYTTSQDLEVRLACVEALSMLGGTENLTFLTSLLLDIEFSVRKKIIEILVQHPGLGHKLLNQFLISNQQFITRYRKLKHPPEELQNVVQKIYSIALGIKILLSKQRK